MTNREGALLVTCPKCQAEPKAPCDRGNVPKWTSDTRGPHAARVVAYLKTKKESTS